MEFENDILKDEFDMTEEIIDDIKSSDEIIDDALELEAPENMIEDTLELKKEVTISTQADINNLNKSNEVKSYQKEININLLVKYANHMFEEYDEERLESMIDSIKELGIITPITVRPKGDIFEILSGHNRVAAAKKLNLKTIPAKIMEGLSDQEAHIVVIEANFNQRSFEELIPSQKAKIIGDYYRTIKLQKNHEKLIRELSKIENQEKNVTSISKNIKNIKFSISPKQILLYVKISNLPIYFLDLLDEGKLTVYLSAQLGFLKHEELIMLQDMMKMTRKNKLTEEQVMQLKRLSKSEELNMQLIIQILMGDYKSEEDKEKGKVKILKIKEETLLLWQENYDFFYSSDEEAISRLTKMLEDSKI